MEADADDPGLLSAAETSLVVDQYELAMCASYFRRGRTEEAVFELFTRKLPPRRDWLLAAGLGPTLHLLREIRFDEEQLSYLSGLGFRDDFLEYLAGFRFSGEVDAMPEGTLFFPDEPVLRVTAPRIEAQLVETLLLNQINFQSMVATKAARVVLAAGGGEPGAGASVVDFSPRRDHGIDAAMKVARSAAVAGVRGTSNMAAAMRYGLTPVGTMAHSYVLSFPSELEAFCAFLEDFPQNTTLLVDTYDTLAGVRNAIRASERTGVELRAVRLDSGDLLDLSRAARGLLDEAGMQSTGITVSGDLEEDRIAALVTAGAPITSWGVGTELGTSRDAPVVNGVYKLVADRAGEGGSWRGVHKRSEGKGTLPGAKQVWRRFEDGVMDGDLVAAIAEESPWAGAESLLVPAMSGGVPCHHETLAEIGGRAAASLASLPHRLRIPAVQGEPYGVTISDALLLAEDD